MGCAFHFNACSAQREGKSKILWREKTKREVGLFSQREKLLQEKGTKGGDEVDDGDDGTEGEPGAEVSFGEVAMEVQSLWNDFVNL